MIITDPGRVGKMRKTTRRIQRINFIPSKFDPQSYRREIQSLIEDPLPKDSKESYFIQLADFMTITNLIAAAFGQGKSILFVSEKLAAMEVVRRRLDEAGLGDFCLELHSHKTQKKSLISDIRTRLERRNTYLSPRQLDSQIEILDKDKEHLKQHAELIGNEFGEIGMTIQEILCSAARYQIDVGYSPYLVYGLVPGFPVGSPTRLGSASGIEGRRSPNTC